MIFGDQKLKTKLYIEKSLFFRFFIFFDRFGMVFAWYDLKKHYKLLDTQVTHKIHTKNDEKSGGKRKNKDFSI